MNCKTLKYYLLFSVFFGNFNLDVTLIANNTLCNDSKNWCESVETASRCDVKFEEEEKNTTNLRIMMFLLYNKGRKSV